MNSPSVQFVSLLEHIPMGVYTLDADFRFAHLNRTAMQMFGAVANVVGRDFADVIASIRERSYADDLIGIFRHTLATGESYSRTETTTLPNRPLSGFYEWRVERIQWDDDRYGLACFFRDISGEVYAQQLDNFRVTLGDALRPLTSPAEVQATAARILGERLLASGVMYAEVEHRADSDYYNVRQYYCAPGVADVSGVYRANDFGKTLFNEMRAGSTLIVNDSAADERLSETERRAYNAVGVHSYINVPLVKDGRHVAIMSALETRPRFWSPIEIALLEEAAERTWAATERAKAEARMRDSQIDSARQRRLYEAILSNTPDFAYIFDAQHRFVYANENLLKMYGRSWDETIGKTFLEVGYEPWHAEMHGREIDQVIASQRPIRGTVPFDGTFGRRIYDYIFVPVFGPNGEVEAVAGTTRDVTDIKESERRKDEFLATLAHELRNPLAPIRNASHILRLSLKNNAQVEQVCDMMERQVSHMVRLVDDLMEISRISRGTIELRRECATLESIVHSAVDTSMPLITASRHELNVLLPPEPVMLYGDSVRLAQVIGNLLNNAAKYTDRGGRILLLAEQHGAELIIRVRDNGVGIAMDSLPHIFDMFMQVKNASSHTHGGLGIGLSLAKHLVEMHGGSLSAASEGIGRGSEFCIRLPCLTSPTPAHDASTAAQHFELKKRVLIVDDNADAASSLAQLVSRLGADVKVANDGAAALLLLQSFNPEIALLDLGMPVMSGFEIAAEARQMPGMEKLKLIALTGWGQPEDHERTLAAGFDHHLVKPADLTELQRVLSSL